jgi:hypothetical protein
MNLHARVGPVWMTLTPDGCWQSIDQSLCQSHRSRHFSVTDSFSRNPCTDVACDMKHGSCVDAAPTPAGVPRIVESSHGDPVCTSNSLSG